ncbi:MAG: hypothetical protein PHO15_07325 [Eubacteriales bacterium]|nr:hypothetical protein [Eubacteriales bacterium]
MKTKTFEEKYKNVKAIRLENDYLSVGVLPVNGAKVFSLYNRITGREYMTQAVSQQYAELKFGEEYIQAEVSGFDDCFPTVDPCVYADYPWEGTPIADHGETCQLKWDYALHDSGVDMEVHGVRFPYVLRKSLRFKDDKTLRIEYEAKNCCAYDMKFIWTGHIMLNAQEGGRIILPYEQGARAKIVFSFNERLGKPGDIVEWPSDFAKDGEKQRFDVTAKRNPNGNNYKLSFIDRIKKGEFIYQYPDGDSVRLLFPQQRISYMNIWVNEGSAFGLHSIAPEPSFGSCDTPIEGEAGVLKARGTQDWYLEFLV